MKSDECKSKRLHGWIAGQPFSYLAIQLLSLPDTWHLMLVTSDYVTIVMPPCVIIRILHPCEIKTSISRGDPASMPPGKSCRTRSGIHTVLRKILWIPVSSTGMTGEGKYGFPCKTCEIQTSISRGDPASMPSEKSCRT